MAAAPVRVIEANARSYRRTWKGSAVTTFLNPVLFLASLGLGLGSLVDSAGSLPEGVTYLAFLGPGLLAASAMQTAAGDTTWPVMAGIKWVKTYHAALATPVQVSDLVAGNLCWVAIRLVMASLAFVVVLMLFGAATFLGGLAAVGPAVLTGMAFAAPIMAFTASIDQETRLSSLFRFGILPMFLLSGTFFPVSQLPDWLEPAAYVTPLWHGVELCRAAALGISPQVSPGWSVAYLAGLTAVGWYLAVRVLKRRMLP